MKLFLTGSSGLIGSHLCKYYENDFEIIKFHRSGDIYSELFYHEPDVIFHCAANIYEPTTMFNDNVVFANEILEYCKNREIKPKLFIISSSSRYGTKQFPMSENDVLEPNTIYSATKGMVDLMAQGYSKVYGLPITIIAPFTIIGAGMKEKMFFPMLYKAWKNNLPIKVSFGNHDIVYIDDFVNAFDHVFNKRISNNENFDVINIGSGRQYSNVEVVRTFQTVINTLNNDNFKYKVELVAPLHSYDSSNWVCDNSKLCDEYNYNRFRSLESLILDFIRNCEKENLYV